MEDRGIEHTGGEIGPGRRWMAAVILPEARMRLIPHGRPGHPDRGDRSLLLGGDGEIPVVDRRLHAHVVGKPVFRPAITVRPGQEEHRSGAVTVDRVGKPSRRRIHLALSELFDRGNLALLLEDDHIHFFDVIAADAAADATCSASVAPPSATIAVSTRCPPERARPANMAGRSLTYV